MSNYLLDQDTKLAIVGNMRQFGGSFVQALSACIMTADIQNLIKIEECFEHYVREYHPSNWTTPADYRTQTDKELLVTQGKGKRGKKE